MLGKKKKMRRKRRLFGSRAGLCFFIWLFKKKVSKKLLLSGILFDHISTMVMDNMLEAISKPSGFILSSRRADKVMNFALTALHSHTSLSFPSPSKQKLTNKPFCCLLLFHIIICSCFLKNILVLCSDLLFRSGNFKHG
jgi:hypothetical protein